MSKKRSNWRLNRKSQVTMEYMILIGFIMIIMIPVGNFMYQTISDLSSNYQLNKLEAYGNEVVQKSKDVYYMGLYSKLSLYPNLNSRAFEMEKVFTAQINSTPDDYTYYFVIDVDDDGLTKRFTYISEVPLITNGTCIPSADTTYFNECATLTCIVCPLDKDDFLDFKLIANTVLNNSVLKVELRNEK